MSISFQCFPDSVSVFGVVFGTVCGRCFRQSSHGHVSLLEERDTVTYDYFIACILRMLIGCLIVLGARMILKVCLIDSFSHTRTIAVDTVFFVSDKNFDFQTL